MQNIRIEAGDGPRQILSMLDGRRFNALITDPPYSSGGAFRGDRARPASAKYNSHEIRPEDDYSGDGMDQRAWASWVTGWMSDLRQAAAPRAFAIIFIDWRQLPTLTDAVQHAGWIWQGLGTWSKLHGRPHLGRLSNDAEHFVFATNGPARALPAGIGGYLPSVLAHSPVHPRVRFHPAQKPVPLMLDLLRLCVPGDLVVDPFVGSGSTAVACARRGLDFLGADLDQKWVDVARRRVETEGADPSLTATGEDDNAEAAAA
jgi:site-specific DNA-methyltransferase (adenine-specific)